MGPEAREVNGVRAAELTGAVSSGGRAGGMLKECAVLPRGRAGRHPEAAATGRIERFAATAAGFPPRLRY
jgi:hypothetical protein